MSSGGNERSVLYMSDNKASADVRGTHPIRSVDGEQTERKVRAEQQERLREFERNIAHLNAIEDQQAAESSSESDVGASGHVAHAEGWKAICTSPDYCKVGKDIVAFNSFASLDSKQVASPDVKARGTAVYRKNDVIKTVQGDAGRHIVSRTSLSNGYVKILDGHGSVNVNGLPVARHDSRCIVNCDSTGVGGAAGKLMTEQKSKSLRTASTMVAGSPNGKKSSLRLEQLKAAREKIESQMLNLDAADEYVDFKEVHKTLDELIGSIKGDPGTLSDYSSQVARGLLGFAKDLVLGTGELAYEAVKVVPKIGRRALSLTGRILSELDAQILAEDIKLGNISASTVGDATLDFGMAIIQPVTDPWAKAQYVEAITRGAAEVFTAGVGVAKSARLSVPENALGTHRTAPTSATATESVNSVVVSRAGKRSSNGVHVSGRVATAPDTAFFWSGKSVDSSGKVWGGPERAAHLAREHNGTTLETLIEKRNIPMPDWDPGNPAIVKQWEDISAEYAAGVSGHIRAVIGSELRPGNIWQTKELPSLMRNPRVKSITVIDPATGVSRTIHP